MRDVIVQWVVDALHATAPVFSAVAGASLVLAVVAYFCLYLFPEVLRGGQIRAVQPLRTSTPGPALWYLLLPVFAITGGVRRLGTGLYSLYVEAVKTKTPMEVRSVPSGARFRVNGKVKSRVPVTGPITDREGAIVYWSIDGWTGTRWKQYASELEAGRFEIADADEYGDSVLVSPNAETEYSLENVDTEVVSVEKNEAVPDDLRRFLQEHAPFAPETLRFQEILIGDGDTLTVFGEMTEQSVDGGWERVVDEPSEDGVRVVVSTESVSQVVKEVWRDASTTLIWGFLLLGYGSLATGGVLTIIADLLPSLL